MALNDYVSAVDVIKLDGTSVVVGTPTVTVLKVDSAMNVLLAKGATVPTDADAGYAVGCIFIKTTAGIGTTLYMNEGSATSADFNAITTSGGAGMTWEQLYAQDNAFDVAGGSGFSINGAMANSNDVLTVLADAAASGDAIQITNSGSGSDIKGTSGTWSFSKLGAMTGLTSVLAGSASGTPALTLTAGDILVSDGALSVTRVGDNAVALTVVNDTATTASVVVVSGSGAFSGSTTTSFMTVTPSGLTTGTAIYVPVAGLTSGRALHIVANALTSGIVMNVTSSATAITGAGRLFLSTHSGATGTSAVLNEFISAANDETVILKVTSSAALALGTAFQVSGASITTGKALEASDLNALTTGKGLHIASSATAITTTGRMFLSDHTGATGTSATLNEFATAGNDETILLKLTATSLTSGAVLAATGANALTTGQVVSISSSATAITTTGRLFLSSHSGATGTSATLNEFTSAAGDETIVLTVGASGALALGKVLFVSGAAVTTGTLLDISDNTAHTTGTAVNIVTNSADTGTRTLLNVKQDHASATGSTVMVLTQDAPTSTNYFKVAKFNTVTLWMGNGTDPNGTLSGTAGDVLFNGASNKPAYCTGTTTWVNFV